MANGHTHVDKSGVAHWCYHKTKNVMTNWQFWAGMTLGFPFEHALWDYVPPFCYITHLLHL